LISLVILKGPLCDKMYTRFMEIEEGVEGGGGRSVCVCVCV
jgi:hypothetical protein